MYMGRMTSGIEIHATAAHSNARTTWSHAEIDKRYMMYVGDDQVHKRIDTSSGADQIMRHD